MPLNFRSVLQQSGLGFSLPDWLSGSAPSLELRTGLPTVTDEQRAAIMQFLGGESAPQQAGGARAADLAGFRGSSGSAADLRAQPGVASTDPNLARASFESNVVNPTLQRFNEETVPGIQRRLGGSLYSSGTRRAGDKAARDVTNSLLGQRVQLEDTLAQRQQQNEQFNAGLRSTNLQAAGAQEQTQATQQLQALVSSGQLSTQQAALLAQVLGIQQIENIGVGLPGREGLLASLIAAGGRVGAAAI